MESDLAPLAFLAIGAVVGAGISLLSKAKQLEDKAEFLQDAKRDMRKAFDDADLLMCDERVPERVKLFLRTLLAMHASEDLGRRFASAVFMEPRRSDETDDSISVAMRQLAEVDPALERLAHRTFVILILGLFVVHYGDGIQATRVQHDLATDPNSVWSRLGSAVGLGGPSHGGGVAHV